MQDPLIALLLVVTAISMVVGLAVIGAAGLALERLGLRPMPPRDRRVAYGSLALAAAGLSCFLYGELIEADWLEVTFTEIRSARLPPGARIRVVHLSDLHVDGESRALAGLPAEVERLRPDLVIFTGDSLNAARGLSLFQATLRAMPAPAGRFAVRGNHDVWSWSQLDLFGRGAATELRARPVVAAGGALVLCGAPYDEGEQVSSCLAEARAVAPSALRVAVYHTPDLIEDVARAGADLYLAGHTHGGQVRVPFYGALLTMSRFGKRYEMGRYELGPTTLYVNRGIGFEPPPAPRVRFLCRPEIAVLDLLGPPL